MDGRINKIFNNDATGSIKVHINSDTKYNASLLN